MAKLRGPLPMTSQENIMKNRRSIGILMAGLFLLGTIAIITNDVSAQGRYINVYSKSTVRGFIDKLEKSSNTFRKDFDKYMDRSNLNGTQTEDQYNRYVKDYENALDRLKRQFNGYQTWWESRSNVQEMIASAQPVNSMIINLPFGRNIESQWRNMRSDINKVADTYDLAGLNGGGWGGGDWNNGWNGSTTAPPSWAVGTFYSSNVQGYTMTIAATGQVTLNGPDGTQYGRWNRNTIYIGNASYPATQSRNGLRAYNQSTQSYTEYSRSGGNGGWGGWNGNSTTPPSWAQGTFVSTNIPGYTMTISSNGRISLSGPDGTRNGRWNNGNINIDNESYPASQSRDGLRAYNQNTRTYTDYARSGNSGTGSGNGMGWPGGETTSPPNWARGTFYSQNIQGYKMTITNNGVVTVEGPGGSLYGRWYKNTIYIGNDEYPATKTNNGMRARNRNTGQETIYVRQF